MKEKNFIASISGGRDSTAMTIRLLEQKRQVDHILFCDTGYELPEMYEYIQKLDRYIQNKFDKEITILKPTTTIEECAFLPYKRGSFEGQARGLPVSIGMSYCTRELKLFRIKEFIKWQQLKNVTCYLGYVAREKRKCGSNGWRCEYPLQEWGWNEPEVDQYLKEKSIYNELYKDFTRTGCFCCPKQNLDSWRVIYAKYPKQWEYCKDMERKAKEKGCVVKAWRADGIPLEVREKQFLKEAKQASFSLDWDEENVSCFCK